MNVISLFDYYLDPLAPDPLGKSTILVFQHY